MPGVHHRKQTVRPSLISPPSSNWAFRRWSLVSQSPLEGLLTSEVCHSMLAAVWAVPTHCAWGALASVWPSGVASKWPYRDRASRYPTQ